MIPDAAYREAPGGMLSVHTFLDTSQVNPQDRLEAWGTVLSRRAVTFRPMSTDTKGVHGLLRGSQVGPLAVNYFQSSPQLIERTERLASRYEDDQCKVMLQLSGTSTVEQGGRRAQLRPGDLTLCDHGRPYTLRVDSQVRMVILLFPRPLLDASVDRLGTVTATCVSGDEAIGGVLSNYLTTVANRLDECSESTAHKLATHAVSLVDTLIEEMLELPAGEKPEPALLLRIQDYVDRNLSDPELSLDQIAIRHDVSRRYLYTLFAEQGETVARWIRDRRLQGCARDLMSQTFAGHSVQAIAGRWGLRSAAHFSRMFKRAYGVTPSEYRRAMPSGRSVR